MGNLKQNKIEDDFSKELSNRADVLVAEMCQYTAPYNPYKQDKKLEEFDFQPLNFSLLGFESMVGNKIDEAFDWAECLQHWAREEKEKLIDHDCHLSQDSSCATCERICELDWLLERSAKLMENLSIDENN